MLVWIVQLPETNVAWRGDNFIFLVCVLSKSYVIENSNQGIKIPLDSLCATQLKEFIIFLEEYTPLIHLLTKTIVWVILSTHMWYPIPHHRVDSDVEDGQGDWVSLSESPGFCKGSPVVATRFLYAIMLQTVWGYQSDNTPAGAITLHYLYAYLPILRTSNTS